ncbi:MAG: phage holin family protein [Betaproteobacteria bacterium]|nr:phage holin family protein [Betaproteobacteria bacterium]
MATADGVAAGRAQESPDRGREVPAAAGLAEPGLLDNAQALWHDLRGLAHDHLQLAALETQRAGKSLVTMIASAVAAGLLLVTAWLGLMAAGAVGLVALGLHPGPALLLVAVLNVAAAYLLYALIRRSSRDLRFPATVRSLQADAALFARPDAS